MAHNRKIEALAEAIIANSGYLDPISNLHASRNPGGLKALTVRHAVDEDGNRVFNCLIDGIQALLYDLEIKLRGGAWFVLKPSDTLIQLADSYGMSRDIRQSRDIADKWARFIRQALHDNTISTDTKLSYFMKEK